MAFPPEPVQSAVARRGRARRRATTRRRIRDARRKFAIGARIAQPASSKITGVRRDGAAQSRAPTVARAARRLGPRGGLCRGPAGTV